MLKRVEVRREWEKLIMRCLMFCIPHQYFAGDKIEKNAMGRACRMYWRGESIVRFSWGGLGVDTTGETQA